MNSHDDAMGMIRGLLAFIGEDPDREGLANTPKRVIKSYEELFGGYNQNPQDILSTTFESDTDELVMCTCIEFWSMCEHHMLPFHGEVHLGYIPNGKVFGLSKLARLVEVYARRLQIQERMTTQIAEAISQVLHVKGVAVVIEAEHLCMKMRGVKNGSSVMRTSTLLGCMKEPMYKHEFFSNISRKSK